MSEAERIETARVKEGGSEESKAAFQEIRDLKGMINHLIERCESLESTVQVLREWSEAESADPQVVTQLVTKVDKISDATAAMAAKVDSTATPGTPYTDTFNSALN